MDCTRIRKTNINYTFSNHSNAFEIDSLYKLSLQNDRRLKCIYIELDHLNNVTLKYFSWPCFIHKAKKKQFALKTNWMTCTNMSCNH